MCLYLSIIRRNRAAPLLDGYACLGDNAVPLRSFTFDVGSEVVRASWRWLYTDLSKAPLYGRLGERGLTGGVELGDDRGRRSRRYRKTIPRPGLEAREA